MLVKQIIKSYLFDYKKNFTTTFLALYFLPEKQNKHSENNDKMAV